MAGLIAGIEGWFTRRRILAVALALGPFILIAELAYIWSQPANRWKFPYGHDFVAFWAAARLWWEGGLAAVYDVSVYAERQAQVSVRPGLLLWHYPPMYLLLVAPFGLLSFGAGYLAFTAGGVAAFLSVARRVLAAPGLFGWAILLGAPVMAALVVQGQNGFYAAAALIGGVWALERGQGWLAAILFALLTAKPQLGPLIPVALLAIGDWRTIWRTAFLSLVFAGAATLVFGTGVWSDFLHNTSALTVALTDDELLAQMPSLWSAGLLAGVPNGLALTVQAVSAAIGMFAVWTVWRGTSDMDLRLATLLIASLIVSPYVFRYDMIFTLCGAMLLARKGLQDGFLRGEALLIGLLWTWPAVFPPIALATGVQTGALLGLAGTWACLRRIRARATPAPAPT